MKLLAVQSYYKVERELTSYEQKMVMHVRLMHLYEDKITTQYRQFPIEAVFDISYRHIGGEEGILYLHTNEGVYSYNINNEPTEFIQAFLERINRPCDE